MRRPGLALSVFVACAAMGLLAGLFLASGVSARGLLTTGTTTTPPPALIPPGVTISGIPVGGLTPEDARFVVRERFDQPLPLVLSRSRRLAPGPGAFGVTARIDAAIDRARTALPGENVPVTVLVAEERLHSYVNAVARRFDRRPSDAQVFLRRLRPKIAPDRPGLTIRRGELAGTIHRRLISMSRAPVRIRTKLTPAEVTRAAFRNVIVIRRGSNQLELFNYERLRKRFRVATGEAVYPTPLGRFRIVVKWRNPWWYPPNSRWARGLKPVPPGPNNPLGTRWMGLSAPGVGIHGTPNSGSIGYSVSHGCIRMHIPDAEWLFGVVDVGTPVFIVAS